MVLFHPTSNPPFSPTGLPVRPKWQNSERYLIEVWDERHWKTVKRIDARNVLGFDDGSTNVNKYFV